ncbi:MAG TPA: hypothetical protein VFC39_07425 [Acidobacteriaceae bacterium]|nr:hypothetical protein [Acidobacteriaceae bacterium]
MQRTIVCLANSYKHGGRCVAGICVETGEWLRLRGKADDGALSPREYALAKDAGELRLLDVFSADLHYPMPSDCHPEDWAVTAMPWQLVERPCPAQRWEKIAAATATTAHILGGYGDRVSADELHAKPIKSSLALVSPDNLWWWIRDERGKRKNRALFHRHNVTYDFAVTDPRWVDQMNLLPLGIYAHSMLAPQATRTWLTVSLSEGYIPRANGPAWHFRIVAGVIAM